MASVSLATCSIKPPSCRLLLSIGTLAAVISLLPVNVALAQGRRTLPRIVLTDEVLDTVTAGATTVFLTLAAYASGTSAVSSTEGLIRTARTTVLSIDFDNNLLPASPPRLVEETQADIVIATGQAEAIGDADAQCVATINNSNTLAFVVQTEARTITATSALCSCSLFGINLLH